MNSRFSSSATSHEFTFLFKRKLVPNCQKGVLNLRTDALLGEQPKGLPAQTLGDIVSAFYHQIRNTLT